jgi:isopropylmalate/homocitrate/citramalate synthase
VKIITGTSGDDLLETTRHAGDVIRIAISEWHRIVGTNNWARIAEIWQHAVATHPSDEEDIVRVQDDFGRR